MPPARGFAPAANKSSASSSVFGAVYSNFCGIISVSPCNQLPDLFRRQRHVNVSNSQRRERIHHRVDYGGRTPDRAPPAPTLAAQSIHRVRSWLVVVFTPRHAGPSRHAVIHHILGDKLADVLV